MNAIRSIVDRVKALLRRFRRLILGVVIFCVLSPSPASSWARRW